MPFYSQPFAAPLSPSLPESQTASYVTYRERHIRPHAYRPFRIPMVKKETTAHDFITGLLSMGDHIPRGTFLPSSKPRGPVGPKPVAAIRRVDRPSKEEECIETSTLPKLSLRRQRAVHPKSPAAATCLGRGTSCSSTASTIRPDPVQLKKAAKVLKPLPSLKIRPSPPSFEIITISAITDTPSPASSEDEEVVTPQNGRVIELPPVDHEEISEPELDTEAKGIATMPGTPLNIPPTPLDIPVDWDDLRQRWSPYKSAHQSAQEEEWCEEDDAPYDNISGGAPFEEVEEPPAPTHAYAAGGMAPSTSVSEFKLSSITSKDLGEYFLLEPMQLQLRASALFSEGGWSSSLPASIGAQTQDETVRSPITSPTPGVSHRRHGSGPTFRADVLGLTPVPSPMVADFPLPPTTVPRSSVRLNTAAPTEPLPKPTLSPTANTPTSLRPALKPQSQSRKKRHGRLVSFDEAALVMRTVRFSGTLDPQFDYTKFEQGNGSAVSTDGRMIGETTNAGSTPSRDRRSLLASHF